MGDAIRKDKRSRLINAVFFILVIGFFIVINKYWNRTPVTITNEIEEGYMLLTGADGSPFTVTVRYDEIKSFKLLDTFDAGTCINGLDKSKTKFGTYENEAYGEYTLCIWAKVKSYIEIIKTDGSVVVFNIESNDATKEMHRALLEYLEDTLNLTVEHN